MIDARELRNLISREARASLGRVASRRRPLVRWLPQPSMGGILASGSNGRFPAPPSEGPKKSAPTAR